MGCYLFNSEDSLIGSQFFNYKAYIYLAFSSSNRRTYFSKNKMLFPLLITQVDYVLSKLVIVDTTAAPVLYIVGQ